MPKTAPEFFFAASAAFVRSCAYICFMPRKPIELPLSVAQSFVRNMKAFFAEKDPIKADAIAAEQMTVLQKYQGPRERPLRIIDVREMFLQLRDEA